jgi:hypothetical protein
LRGNKRLVSEPQAPRQTAPPRPCSARPSRNSLRAGDLGWLVRYSLRGLGELIRARIIFDRLNARDIPLRNQRVLETLRSNTAAPATLTKRITYVIPRLSRRLPWRSDCLIQAIAAQNWLASHGYASEIQIGVQRPDNKPFSAHAWLVHGETVVTGGDITVYQKLIGDLEPASMASDCEPRG